MRKEHGGVVQRTSEGISSCSNKDGDRANRIYGNLRVQLVGGKDECTLWDLGLFGEGELRVER
jgi:hypothetical protein